MEAHKLQADAPLSDRVDAHFRHVGLPLHDCNGMMRHILDCLGALKVRLSEEEESEALVQVFGGAVGTIVAHITHAEPIDAQSAVTMLLDCFPDDMKRRDGRGWMPLHWAAAVHDTDAGVFQAICAERPVQATKGHLHCTDEVPGESPYKGLLPIHLAVSVQHPIIANIRNLLEINSDTLALPDHRGWLALHWCAYNCRDADILKLLIRRYGDGVYTSNKKGKLPFQLSAYNRHTEVMEVLYAENQEAAQGMDYNGNTPLHDAAKSFNAEAAATLFRYRSDMGRVRNFKEQLPIHRVFAHIPAGSSRLHARHLSTVNTLLRMNPETASLPDLNDSLPLHLAVFFNSSLEVVQAVYNVYPSAALVKDNTGRLPMHYCTLPEVKKLLLSASAPLARAGITDSFSRFST